MEKGVTRAEMVEIDRRATVEFAMPSLLLMENAGLRASDIIRAEFGKTRFADIVILCGKGNNGGDGFVAARHLLNAGAPVRVLSCVSEPRIFEPGDAGTNATILARMGHSPCVIDDPDSLEFTEGTLVVDAIFGTGLRGEVRGLERQVIERIERSSATVVSIDIPSGLDADLGVPLGVAVTADVTVTLALPKRGFFVGDGAIYAGRIEVVDIGIPRSLLEPLRRRGSEITGRS
ncbi:MAG: NAD(P)H-hydrate epimerase [Planctomycetes bacterium]|nr:NAD(P)H-hydrate epimerase [Planctomycetota bacterium]MBI3846772.1 NAD(P)H-hydrate epimerase [Planctomycetota bacterium]